MLRDGEIVAHRVWKRFRPDLRRRNLSSHIRHLPARIRGHRDTWMWALSDVDFKIEQGEAVGLVGANGSGKSTLLKILNRVMYPYAGSVQIQGRTGALIEVTTGLHPELSGRENVMLYGSLLGLKRRDVNIRFEDIVEFAEIAHAIDRQLKFYSSGMRMRLGFAVAAFLEPSILLVDEVLAVGDARFQQRCLDRMSEVHNQGTTLVYVSHDLQTVEAACPRAIWLHNGVVMDDAPVGEVLAGYRGAVEQQVELTPVIGQLSVESATVIGPDGGTAQSSEPLDVEIAFTGTIDSSAKVFLGVTLGTASPIVLVSEQCEIKRGTTRIRCTLASLPIPQGTYYLWVSVGPIHGQRGQLLPWGPATTFDVVGPALELAPRGVVRLGPVFVDTDWHQS
jgi:ABC-type polysaccharide/polyol phosphate transport system ATPase subunit